MKTQLRELLTHSTKQDKQVKQNMKEVEDLLDKIDLRALMAKHKKIDGLISEQLTGGNELMVQAAYLMIGIILGFLTAVLMVMATSGS